MVMGLGLLGEVAEGQSGRSQPDPFVPHSDHTQSLLFLTWPLSVDALAEGTGVEAMLSTD